MNKFLPVVKKIYKPPCIYKPLHDYKNKIKQKIKKIYTFVPKVPHV